MFLSQVEQRNQRFAELREDFLLGYGYHTARAYWGDLEDIKDWADGRGFDVLELSEAQFKQFLARMRRRGYSPSTVRRRVTAFNGLVRHRAERSLATEAAAVTSPSSPSLAEPKPTTAR